MSLTRAAPKTSPEKLVVRRLRRTELPANTIKLRASSSEKLSSAISPGRLSAALWKTEPIQPGDPAGHHFRGPTPRIRSMYLAPGHAYIFFNYGALHAHVLSERAGIAAAILIRALEPLEGIKLMRATARPTGFSISRAARDALLPHSKSGAARRTRPLRSGRALLGESSHPVGPIGKTIRIGITQAADRLLRVYERGNPFVQRPEAPSPPWLDSQGIVFRVKIIRVEAAFLPYPKFL